MPFSPIVRDHQYNEDVPVDNEKEALSLRDHTFIKLQYQRDRTFQQGLESLVAKVSQATVVN
jgi:hypothetical protein